MAIKSKYAGDASLRISAKAGDQHIPVKIIQSLRRHYKVEVLKSGCTFIKGQVITVPRKAVDFSE